MSSEVAPLSCGRPGKRDAILTGAAAVFAEDGYTRAGIGAIAKRAEVSTRTIYNYFRDKADLFGATITASTTRVAEAQIAIIDRHFHKITDLEADLNAFGRDLTAALSQFSGHFAMITQVKAEQAHLPAEALAAWQRAGPDRVFGHLAERLAELDRRGLLRVAEPYRAAMHLLNLLMSEGPARHSLRPAAPDEVAATVAEGVRVFLYGYLAR